MAGNGLCRLGSTLAIASLAPITAAQAQTDAPRPVTITVDAGRPDGPLPLVWRFFGADEPNYATMKDGRKLLVELGALKPGQVYFRAHNLLNTGDGTAAFKWGSTNAYTEDKDGKPVYDWTISRSMRCGAPCPGRASAGWPSRAPAARSWTDS